MTTVPRILRPTDDDEASREPSILGKLAKPNSCVGCKHGAKCAGKCGKRVCAVHAYQCSRCDGQMCEACWERHEVRGAHT